jgi:hypothetical protein
MDMCSKEGRGRSFLVLAVNKCTQAAYQIQFLS